MSGIDAVGFLLCSLNCLALIGDVVQQTFEESNKNEQNLKKFTSIPDNMLKAIIKQGWVLGVVFVFCFNVVLEAIMKFAS